MSSRSERTRSGKDHARDGLHLPVTLVDGRDVAERHPGGRSKAAWRDHPIEKLDELNEAIDRSSYLDSPTFTRRRTQGARGISSEPEVPPRGRFATRRSGADGAGAGRFFDPPDGPGRAAERRPNRTSAAGLIAPHIDPRRGAALSRTHRERCG